MLRERLIRAKQKDSQREDSLKGKLALESVVAEAIEDLGYRRKTIFEMPPVEIRSDVEFETANPEHPEAASNRFRRIDAVEYLYEVVRLLNGYTVGVLEEIVEFFRTISDNKRLQIERGILPELHDALFDRDAAVRLTVVETLAILARPESIPLLERLSRSEDEGTLIPGAAAKALDCCQNSKPTDIRNHISAARETLNGDVVDCVIALRRTDSQVHRRSLVRAVFAAIEGFVSVMKADVIEDSYAGRFTLSRAERAVLLEEAYDLTDTGQPRLRPFFLPTAKNVRFVFALFARVRGLSAQADYSGDGWRAFREAVEIRNRITHPKASVDLSISSSDLKLTEQAYAWFLDATFALNPEGREEISELLDAARQMPLT
jgi:hypothetical protein